MERGNDWTKRVAVGVGRRVAQFRKGRDGHGRGLTVQALADRCSDLGLPLGRPAISKLENGLRHTVSVDEVSVLAAALRIPPVLLMFPLGSGGDAEVLPGRHASAWDAVLWFTGDAALVPDGDGRLAAVPVEGGYGTADLYRQYQRYVARWERDRETDRWKDDDATGLQLFRAIMRNHGLVPPDLPPGLARIEDAPDADNG